MRRPAAGACFALGVAVGLLSRPTPALAAPPDAAGGAVEQELTSAVLWPTLTPAGDGPIGGELRLPANKDGALRERAREIDAILTDAAQDLGLLVDVGSAAPRLPRVVRDGELVEAARASKAWLISPRIERDGSQLIIRIVAVPPGSKVALLREERATPETLAVRVVVMLRDLVNARGGQASPEVPVERRHAEHDEPPDARGRARSPGRGVLSISMAAYGGYVGYALQKASRGDDPRLLYPLMAIGTGVGLGAATIVADEWDVGVGAAWPATSALLITAGHGLEPPGDRHAFALLSGLAGMGLTSVVLSQKSIGEGPALLTHSGGALGMFLGGLGELAIKGTTDATAEKGLGYGAGAGVLLAGVVATQIQVPAGRIWAADLGAGVGALAGAAASSPLLLKNATEGKQRAWLGVTMAGTLLGAATGLWLSAPAQKRPGATAEQRGTSLARLPMPAIVAVTPTPSGGVVAAPGLAWGGSW
jgi:hypothetical protein